jgi:hypothetical protein
MTTVVTALYNINREIYDGRKMDDYFNWLQETLKLNTNFVIFAEDDIIGYIPKQDNIKIIYSKLNEIPFFKYKNTIESIISSDFFKENILDPHRIECINPLYNIIQYSKFEWLKSAIDKNIFNSNYYFWMDAGCSRFFNTKDLSQNWPQNYQLLNNQKLLIQGNVNTVNYLYNWPGDDKYILDSNCILVGTLFGGHKTICLKIADLVEKFFEKYLSQGIINNEQIILGVLLKNYPELFNVYIELNNQHLPLFKKLYEN